jgi:hypothetical protein
MPEKTNVHAHDFKPATLTVKHDQLTDAATSTPKVDVSALKPSATEEEKGNTVNATVANLSAPKSHLLGTNSCKQS